MATSLQQPDQATPMNTQSGAQGGFKERSLIIKGLSAHFQKDKDLIGSQDPYFILGLSGDEVKTRVVKSGGTDPVWEPEEGYRLYDRGEHPELLVHAYNKNTLLKDSSLGEGKIPMIELGSGGSHTVPLFDKKGEQTGTFMFSAKEEGPSQGTGATGQTTGDRLDHDVGTGAALATGAVGAGAAGAGLAHQQRDRDQTAGQTTGALTTGQTYDQTTADHDAGKHHGGGLVGGLLHKGDKDRDTTATTIATDRDADKHHGGGLVGGLLHKGDKDKDTTTTTTTTDKEGGKGGFLGGLLGRGSKDTDTTDSTGKTGLLHKGGVTDAHGQQTGNLRDGGVETGQRFDSNMQGGNIKNGGVGGVGATGVGATGAQQGGYATGPQQGGEYATGGQQGGLSTGQKAGLAAGIGAGALAGTAGVREVHERSNKDVNDRDVNTTSDTHSSAIAGGLGQQTTTRNTTTEESSNVNESSEYHRTGGGGPIKDLESSDDHWEKSLAASAEARRQAQLVEKHSQATHTKLLAAQQATRDFDKARREHMAIQERLAALDLEAKRAEFEKTTAAYEAVKNGLSGKEKAVGAAQADADAMRAIVNDKGEALDAQVQETKLHQERLAALAAELERLRAAHADADRSHQALLADFEPKRQRHQSLKDHFHIIRSELVDHQRRRATLEAQEAELEGQLATHNAEYEATGNDLSELVAMGDNRGRAVADAERERQEAEAELAQVQAALADHRQRIGLLKQDTEASLATAQKIESDADAKERALAEAQARLGQQEADAGRATQELTTAEGAVVPLHEKIRKEKTTVDKEDKVVEELHRKLGMAKQDVDLAQAKKEELWEKAKYHGEQADKQADKHYLFAHKEFGQIMPGGGTVDPQQMTQQGAHTSNLLEKAGAKLGV